MTPFDASAVMPDCEARDTAGDVVTGVQDRPVTAAIHPACSSGRTIHKPRAGPLEPLTVGQFNLGKKCVGPVG